MDLYITRPNGIIYFYPRFCKIRALVGIIIPRMNYLQQIPAGGCKIAFIKMLKLPDVLKKPFLHKLVLMKEVKDLVNSQ